MITRRARNNLRDVADSDFLKMAEDLMHREVSDFATNIYAVLSVMANKFSPDAVVDLIPEIIAPLNRLDAALKVNSDLTKRLQEISVEVEYLKKTLECEKQSRKVYLETSISFEEETERDIRVLNENLSHLVTKNKDLLEEIRNKSAVIDILTADISVLNRKLEKNETKFSKNQEGEEAFQKYTKNFRPSFGNMLVHNSVVETRNRFASLSAEGCDAVPGTLVQVEVEVHRDQAGSQVQRSRVAVPNYNIMPKKRLQVLSDSHGKFMCQDLDDVVKGTSNSVLSKPGAKMKHVLKEGRGFVEGHSRRDYVVIFCGTNDIGRYEPYQWTIQEALNDLFSWNLDTNLIIVDVPYRYDNSDLNDSIFLSNTILKKRIEEYTGNSRIFHLHINEVLRNRHYRRDGLHLNRRGRRLLVSKIANVVCQVTAQEASKPSQTASILRGRSQEGSQSVSEQADLAYHVPSQGDMNIHRSSQAVPVGRCVSRGSGRSESTKVARRKFPVSEDLPGSVAGPSHAELLPITGSPPVQLAAAEFPLPVTLEHDTYAEALMSNKASTPLFLENLTP